MPEIEADGKINKFVVVDVEHVWSNRLERNDQVGQFGHVRLSSLSLHITTDRDKCTSERVWEHQKHLYSAM